jgi:hypothetical protein
MVKVKIRKDAVADKLSNSDFKFCMHLLGRPVAAVQGSTHLLVVQFSRDSR